MRELVLSSALHACGGAVNRVRSAAVHLEESEQHFEHELLAHHLGERLPDAVVPSVLEEERPDHRQAQRNEPFRRVDLITKER